MRLSPKALAILGIIIPLSAKILASGTPKASDDASYTITLYSDKIDTSFYVDDEFMGKGDKLRVLINPNKAHSFSAEAPGYNKLPPARKPPNFNYASINDQLQLSFNYPDAKDYRPPKLAGTVIEGGTFYGPVGGGEIGTQNIKQSTSREVPESQSHSSHGGIGFTKEDLELVKSACLAGSSFEFLTEADGTISVKNVEGKGKLHVSKKSLDVVDLPDANKQQEFSEIRKCIKDYLFRPR